jgi:dipeptidyl aminopeptidase/acylaminoacyl peptidase
MSPNARKAPNNVIPNARKARVRACFSTTLLSKPKRYTHPFVRRLCTMRHCVSRVLVLLSLASVASLAAAQAKHPFTFEDMMKLKRVGDPQVSPDGKWVIFSVVDVDLAANTKTPHVWIVPLAGGQERELISDQDADRPRWAPDGKRFAFLSTKEGGSQVWIADFDVATGTVAAVRRLTSIATEASGELWSPDGLLILFISDVYPECDAGLISGGQIDAEGNCNAKKSNAAEQSKVKAQVFDHLLYRHWNAYKEGKRTHIFVLLADPLPKVEGTHVVPGNYHLHFPHDLTPGDYDAPVFSLGGQDNYAFSPDGKEICYTSNHDKNPAASTNNDLWIVPIWGMEQDSPAEIIAKTKNITADNPASDSTPLYSPDGRYIAYRAQQRPGYESDRFRLMLYDRKTGEKKNLTENWGHWVGDFAWGLRSTSIYFVGENAGESWIYQKMLDGANWKRTQGYHADSDILEFLRGSNDDLAVAVPKKVLLYTEMSIQRPNEIYWLPIDACFYAPSICDGADPMFPKTAYSSLPLTHLNDAVLSQVAMSPIEPFWFTGAHNDKVEGFLVKPPNFDASKKYPVKFLIHGGPEGSWGDDWSYRWNAELFASPTAATPNGFVVLMINFHGSTGYGQKFIDAINGDWGGAPYEDLMKGLDYAEQTYPFIDKARECALGASYGGYMINWILGHTDRFKCAVSHDGMFNAESAWGTTEELWFNNWEFKGTPYDNRELYRKWSPHEYAKNFQTPTLVVHGQRDYRLDVSQGFDLFTTLQMEGVPSKMLYFPDEGHWVLKPQNSQLWYKTVNDWVDRWIGDQWVGDQKIEK